VVWLGLAALSAWADADATATPPIAAPLELARSELAAGRFGAASRALDDAMSQLAGTSQVDLLVEVLGEHGELAEAEGRYAVAERYFTQAEAYARTLGAGGGVEAPPARAWAMARLAFRRGDHGPMTALARQPIRCDRTGGPCEAESKLVRGLAALDIGDPRAAHRALTEAGNDLGQLGAGRQRVQALLGLGEALDELGRPGEARRAAAMALSEGERLGLTPLLARAHALHARLALATGSTADAEQHLERARGAYDRLGSRPALARSQMALADLMLTERRLDEAAAQWQAAERIYQELGDRPGVVAALLGRAETARAAGRVAEERELLERVSPDLTPSGEHVLVLARLGDLLLAEGRPEAARRWLDLASEGAEKVPAWAAALAIGEVGVDREAWLSRRRHLYDALVEAELKTPSRGAWPALQAAERASARTLLDLLERARLEADRPELKRTFADLSRIARAERTARETLGGPALERVLASLARERARTEQRLFRLEDLGTARQELKGRVREALTTAARALAPGAALCKYHLAPGTSFAFVLHAGGVEVVRLPGSEILGPLAVELHEDLMRPHAHGVPLGRAARLYDALLRPLEPALGGRTRLVILADAELRVVPFDVLVDRTRRGPGGRPAYAVDHYTISYAPSITALAEIHASPQPVSERYPVMAFGDPAPEGPAAALPRLAWAGRELETVARHLQGPATPGTRYAQAEATEERLKALALERYRVLHLATHGVTDSGSGPGGAAALVLTPTDREDGLLTLDEVMELGLGADLVVLSACSTGEGKASRGDGLSGLTGAFLFAGASSVMAALWAVEDAHTARLMDRFYAAYARGASSAAALREARLALLDSHGPLPAELALRGIAGTIDPTQGRARRRGRRSQPRSADPFFWAPFVLVGDAGDILR
jgi:CHAT domain-containing protein